MSAAGGSKARPEGAPDPAVDPDEALRTLTALGFGPDSALMTEPKLFVDRHFLSVLLAELDGELGKDGARALLYQIGFLHGLRDAARVAGAEPDPMSGELPVAEAPAVAMELGARPADAAPGEVALPGRWPEAYEAEARLCGPGAATDPACALSAGYTSGWLSEAFETDVLAVEDHCRARGDEACRFSVREPAAWRQGGRRDAVRILAQLPTEALRQVAAREGGVPVELPPVSHIDVQAPVVHVWGPVMVLPFENPDEALGTLDMLSREAADASVRAVVLDLRHHTLDEGFGAAALETAIATIESWGAEAVLTSVSPLSEGVVQGLEIGHLLVRKDLPDAIATAFQIVEAQRHAF